MSESAGGVYLAMPLQHTINGIGLSNPLEPYLASAWNYMTDNYSLFTIAVIGSYLLHAFFQVVFCAAGFTAQFLPFLQKYKIQQQVSETFEGQWKSVKYILCIHLFLHITEKLAVYYFMTWMGMKYDYESMPRWYTIVAQIFASLVVEDTWHYFAHRLLHHTKLYKHVHKLHHSYQAPFAFIADYTHPFEFFFLGFGTFLGMIFFMDHLMSIWVWTVVRFGESVKVHSGYDIPYVNPLKLLPGYGGPRFHDFHHQNFVGNYASTFVWWDRLLGTDRQYIEFKKQKDARKLE